MRGWGTLLRVAAGTTAVLAIASLFAAGAVAGRRSARGSTDVTPAISLIAPDHIHSGSRATVSGTVAGAPAGSTVQLYASPYPYTASTPAQTTTTAGNGSYSFTVAPDRSTRYRVVVPATAAQAAAAVGVIGKAIVKVRAASDGHALVTIVIFHPRDLRWGGAAVSWSFASPGSGGFVRTPATKTSRLSPYVIALRTSIALSAGRFHFRACLHAQGTGALLSSLPAPGCSGLGYRGGGSLPQGFPGPAAVARAARYLAGRVGRTAFAVVDSEGRLSGVNIHRTFPTASVVKAMMLVEYLRMLHARRQHYVDSYSNSFLYPMIHVSDNNAATQTWSIVGDSGLYRIAQLAGMTDFSVSGLWGTALLSPADQARYFYEMDSLIPREFIGYAHFLLSTIVGWQTWAIPVVARPLGYQVWFKDGSEPTGLGELVHQVARIEGHGRKFSLAVMTDGDPSMQYGIDTIQGAASALL